MLESKFQKFNHLKLHTQYSICEGAIKIDELKESSKENKIKSLAICDTSNLCGALEFSDKLSKIGTQPIIGTQINFKYEETMGLLPLFAMNEIGYKRIIELSSLSYLNDGELSEPNVPFNELLKKDDGIAIFSGTVFGLFGNLFDKGKYSDIEKLYSKLKSIYKDRFYIELQRHGDRNEDSFEKMNLKKSNDLEIPLIATNETFYIDKDMHEAHDALICIKNKTYIQEKNRVRFSNKHYLRDDKEMYELFSDIPEALENNYNFPIRCSYKPSFSKPILPNISSEKDGNADDILKKNSLIGLKDKFIKVFKKKINDLTIDQDYKKYLDRLNHELNIITEMEYSSYFLIVSDYIK